MKNTKMHIKSIVTQHAAKFYVIFYSACLLVGNITKCKFFVLSEVNACSTENEINRKTVYAFVGNAVAHFSPNKPLLLYYIAHIHSFMLINHALNPHLPNHCYAQPLFGFVWQVCYQGHHEREFAWPHQTCHCNLL